MRKSLKTKMLFQAVLPLLFLAVVVFLVSYYCFRGVVLEQTKTDMRHQCQLLEQTLERIYPGEYSFQVVDETHYRLYKGDYDITSSEEVLDNLKEAYGDELTIFCRDVSVLTTMVDENGERFLLGSVSPIVASQVLDQEEEKFYYGVKLQGEKYFAYYQPILREDGVCFGMFAVFRPADEVQKSINRAMLPIVIVYLVATVFIGFLSISYSQKIVSRIRLLQNFIGKLSKGNFDGVLPANYFRYEDELAELGRNGLAMQKSLQLVVEGDALTQLNNRRYGDARLKKVMHKAAATGSDFCVAIGDVDFFKNVNDTYGHDAGDEVLKGVAEVLKKHMAGKGFVARWGGEEFLFVFEMTELDAAANALQEMLDEIRTMEIESGESVVMVTMSYGVTQAWKDATADELLKKADERLYIAKTTGRNQVVSMD